jgi:hypothetical protein
MLDKITNWVEEHWWEILAIAAAPLVSIVLTQKIKRFHQRAFGFKPHWILLDLFSTISCFAIAYQCWMFQYNESNKALMVAFIVCVLQLFIVKMVFFFLGKVSPELAEEIADTIDVKTLIFGRKPKNQEKPDD